MIKHLEQWIAGIFHKELVREIAALRAEMSFLRAEIKAHTTEIAKGTETHVQRAAAELKTHAVEIAADLHAKVASDAKAIMQFQQTARLGCSWCGQLSRTYLRDKTTGKITCADCQQKGRG